MDELRLNEEPLFSVLSRRWGVDHFPNAALFTAPIFRGAPHKITHQTISTKMRSLPVADEGVLHRLNYHDDPYPPHSNETRFMYKRICRVGRMEKFTLLMDGRVSVAIVGTGLAGLAAIKEFSGAGFDVTALERHDEVAGIWAYHEDPMVRSVAKSTLPNVSKYMVTSRRIIS